jgi:hypothetical protein
LSSSAPILFARLQAGLPWTTAAGRHELPQSGSSRPMALALSRRLWRGSAEGPCMLPIRWGLLSRVICETGTVSSASIAD